MSAKVFRSDESSVLLNEFYDNTENALLRNAFTDSLIFGDIYFS